VWSSLYVNISSERVAGTSFFILISVEETHTYPAPHRAQRSCPVLPAHQSGGRFVERLCCTKRA
jgi:hypothetical protein